MLLKFLLQLTLLLPYFKYTVDSTHVAIMYGLLAEVRTSSWQRIMHMCFYQLQHATNGHESTLRKYPMTRF